MLVGCLLLIRRLRKGGGKTVTNYKKILCDFVHTFQSSNHLQISNSGKTKLEQGHSRSSSKTEEALKLWKIEESGSEFTLYDFPELGAATNNFSEDNKLGTGGFGPVYKAYIC
jgi:hypothetical protein